MGKSTTWIAMFNSIKSYVCMFTRPGTCLKSHFVEISWILISHFVEVFLPGSVMRWPTTEFELAPRVSQGYPRCETDQLINLTQTFIPCLVVEPPLWKIWKSVGMIISNIWKNKKCSKPPTSSSCSQIARAVHFTRQCLEPHTKMANHHANVTR